MGKDSKARKKQTGKVLSFIPNGEYYFKKGIKAYHRRDFKLAKKYLQRAMQLEPGEPMIVCQLAVVYTEMGEFQESNRLLYQILEELDEEMTECHYFLANNYAHLGFFKDAYRHANIYMELEQDGEFTDDTEELLELLSIEADDLDEELFEEDDLIVKQDEARVHLEAGNFKEAITILTNVLNDYPEYWSAYNNLALAHFYLGEMDKAFKLTDEVLEKNPGNLHALCNQLVFAYYQRKKPELKKLTNMLSNINPILGEHQFKLGATFALIGEYELSYPLLRKLQKHGYEGDGAFFYWLSYASYYTGREKKARYFWKKLLEVSPEKEGLEPWNEERPSATGYENNLSSILKKMDSEYIEDRLFALFLISLSPEKETILASDRFQDQQKMSFLEKQYLDFMKTDRYKPEYKYVANAHETAKMLYEYHQPIDSMEAGLYLMWFSVFSESVKNGKDFRNNRAWAAAIEYVWHKLRSDKTTQKEVAEQYGLATSTLAKYVKLVNTLLD